MRCVQIRIYETACARCGILLFKRLTKVKSDMDVTITSGENGKRAETELIRSEGPKRRVQWYGSSVGLLMAQRNERGTKRAGEKDYEIPWDVIPLHI